MNEPKLETPTKEEDYSFPFKPYKIQLDLMQNIFETIEQNKIGIFESPTGTGKSLSLICATMTWLINNDNRYKEALDKPIEVVANKGNGPLWLQKQKIKKQIEIKIQEENEKKDIINKIREKEKVELNIFKRNLNKEKKNFNYKVIKENENEKDEDEWILDDYYQDSSINNNISNDPRVIELMDKLDDIEDNRILKEAKRGLYNEEEPEEIKIYYASRTHSQLVQFIKEFKRTTFSKLKHEKTDNLKYNSITLGSRNTLCNNESIKKKCKGDNELLNEKCTDLQKPDVKIENKCQFYLPKNKPILYQFKHATLENTMDIEDLVKLGHNLNTCAYYGVRKSIPPARLVAVPYNLLLNEKAREASGIKLEGNIVIIDEAHNLIESMESTFSSKISLKQIITTNQQLNDYLIKYINRLKGENVMFIKQTLSILKSIIKCYDNNTLNDTLNVTKFLLKLNIDQLNLLSVTKYLRESKINNKLHGFINRDSNDSVNLKVHIYTLESFLNCLTLPDDNGKLIIENNNEDIIFRYLLLDSNNPFKPILEETRSTILIGGTLSPLQEYVDSLCGEFKNNINTFKCNHIVSKESIKCFTLNKGPTMDNKLKFVHSNFSDFNLLDEVAKSINNIINVVPCGVVCFFTSYKYLDSFLNRIKSNNNYNLINNKKRIFLEPKNASDVDSTLNNYQMWIDKCNNNQLDQNDIGKNGAILFCVINGKLSEGINFSDDLARAVIVVGLPFANLNSVDLKIKMQYLDMKNNNKSASKEYYENLCMRAINQSIGRAIRHINDYSAIILIDDRYSNNSNLINKLPGWIVPSIEHCDNFDMLMNRLGMFFKLKAKS